jgi:hypothetical protein
VEVVTILTRDGLTRDGLTRDGLTRDGVCDPERAPGIAHTGPYSSTAPRC